MPNLVRYNQPLVSIFDELERNFNRFFPFYQAPPSAQNYWLPEVDIKEEDNIYVVKIDVPGMDKKDIKINIDQYNNLVIEGERESEYKKEKKDYIRFERYKGSFYRQVALPCTVDAQNIKAKYYNGVLEINIPKAKENMIKPIILLSNHPWCIDPARQSLSVAQRDCKAALIFQWFFCGFVL